MSRFRRQYLLLNIIDSINKFPFYFIGKEKPDGDCYSHKFILQDLRQYLISMCKIESAQHQYDKSAFSTICFMSYIVVMKSSSFLTTVSIKELWSSFEKKKIR